MLLGFEVAGLVLFAAAAGVVAGRHFSRTRTVPAVEETAPAITPVAAAAVKSSSGEVQLVRPNPGTVEGLEIRYGEDALVRAVRVGAMNCEHKELLLTMDDVQWKSLPNAQKQEVLAAARSTWAAKMCGAGPDIAYVVVKTERGEIVGRADPHSVTVL